MALPSQGKLVPDENKIELRTRGLQVWSTELSTNSQRTWVLPLNNGWVGCLEYTFWNKYFVSEKWIGRILLEDPMRYCMQLVEGFKVLYRNKLFILVRTPAIAAAFMRAKRWKQLKCPSTDEWINKMWSIHTTEYYSAVKNNEVLISATTWVHLKNLMLCRSSQGPNIAYLYDLTHMIYPE